MTHVHYPRGGVYEIFTYDGITYCFDDASIKGFPTPQGMFSWLRELPPEHCRPMDDGNVAYYLSPEMYTVWKLKWA